VTGCWFSPGPPVSFTNKTDRHNVTEILSKVVLNTIKQTRQKLVQIKGTFFCNFKVIHNRHVILFPIIELPPLEFNAMKGFIRVVQLIV
jgi:hypothetical protein